MRCVRYILFFLFVAILLPACEGPGTSTEALRLPGWYMVYLQQKPSAPVNSAEKEIPIEESVQNEPESQFLIEGIVQYAGFPGGEFLVEARGTRSCKTGMCPDFDSVPLSSILLKKPSYFVLVTPNKGQALFLVATHTAPDQSTKVEELFLGTPEGRVSNLKIDFNPAP